MCVQEILQYKKEWQFISKKKKGKTAGILLLEKFNKAQKFDFIDYL